MLRFNVDKSGGPSLAGHNATHPAEESLKECGSHYVRQAAAGNPGNAAPARRRRYRRAALSAINFLFCSISQA